MNLLERAALDTGLKITRSAITEHFFPLPFSDYVVLQADARFESRKYEYWVEVLTLIGPILTEKGIQIVTVGAPGELILNGTHCLVGKTTINQLAYIIKNSKLVFGPDSLSLHLAGHYNVPFVGLYPNMFHEQSQPYFGNKLQQICLEPLRKGLKPSYSAVEQPKTINWIKPETIAAHVLSLLGLGESVFPQSLFFGQYYTRKIIENVPDQVVGVEGLGVDNIIMRMDFLHNEDILAEQLQKSKCSIITKRPINPELIKAFKTQIVEVVYEIDEEYSLEFVDCLQKAGLNYVLFTYKNDEWLNPIKLDFFDYRMVNSKGRMTKDSISELKDIPVNEILFKSNKFTLSKGKIYLSKSHWLIDCPTPNFQTNTGRAIDSSEFWGESESLYFLRGQPAPTLTNDQKTFRLEDIKL